MARRCLTLFLTAFASWCAFAGQPADPLFLGSYSSTGRACYGTMKLTLKQFSWVTPFTQIKNSPYKILEQSKSETEQKITLEILKKDKKWIYPVVTISHTSNIPEQCWNAVGYQSMEDFQKDNLPDSLCCLMLK